MGGIKVEIVKRQGFCNNIVSQVHCEACNGKTRQDCYRILLYIHGLKRYNDFIEKDERNRDCSK